MYETLFYVHTRHEPLKAAAAKGIKIAYTAALEGVPLCYTYSSYYMLAEAIAAE